MFCRCDLFIEIWDLCMTKDHIPGCIYIISMIYLDITHPGPICSQRLMTNGTNGSAEQGLHPRGFMCFAIVFQPQNLDESGESKCSEGISSTQLWSAKLVATKGFCWYSVSQSGMMFFSICRSISIDKVDNTHPKGNMTMEKNDRELRCISILKMVILRLVMLGFRRVPYSLKWCLGETILSFWGPSGFVIV